MRLLALRGAITCDENTKEQVWERTQRLVQEMLERNAIDADDLVSIIFTATDDLNADFPAAAARPLGLHDVPLICAREIAVPGSMERCIRVLMHFYGSQSRAEVHHVYLERARALRNDLPE